MLSQTTVDDKSPTVKFSIRAHSILEAIIIDWWSSRTLLLLHLLTWILKLKSKGRHFAYVLLNGCSLTHPHSRIYGFSYTHRNNCPYSRQLWPWNLNCKCVPMQSVHLPFLNSALGVIRKLRAVGWGSDPSKKFWWPAYFFSVTSPSLLNLD